MSVLGQNKANPSVPFASTAAIPSTVSDTKPDDDAELNDSNQLKPCRERFFSGFVSKQMAGKQRPW